MAKGPADLSADVTFDLAFSNRAGKLSIRPEVDEDRDFLVALFVACSPMAASMPTALLHMQANMQIDSHRSAHPNAMRRIVCADGSPIGRIMVDWNIDHCTHGIDIAVLPDARGTGAGLHMLRAWLATADQMRQTCRLEVISDNPARHIYAKLGFVAQAETLDQPSIVMIRPTRDQG